MRVMKVFTKPLAAIVLFAGTAAVAGDLATLDSFKAADSTPTSTMLCIVPSDAAVGLECDVYADGLPVAAIILAPGSNYVMSPAASCYTAAGPGISAKSILQEGLGLN